MTSSNRYSHFSIRRNQALCWPFLYDYFQCKKWGWRVLIPETREKWPIADIDLARVFGELCKEGLLTIKNSKILRNMLRKAIYSTVSVLYVKKKATKKLNPILVMEIIFPTVFTILKVLLHEIPAEIRDSVVAVENGKNQTNSCSIFWTTPCSSESRINNKISFMIIV